MGNFKSGFLGGLSSGLGSGIAGMGLQAIGGIFSGIQARKQHKRQKELMQLQNQMEVERMGLQAKLNKEQAAYNQDLSKEMFDYTFDKEASYNSPIEQRKRLEAAGLNPALLYGSSASGASGTASGSTAGGEAAGVQALQPMGLQVALQAEQQKAQIELAKSQAAANWAQAGKTIGVDTQEGKKNIEEADSRILLNQAQQAKTTEEINETLEKIKSLQISNEISEETKKAEIDTKLESLNILHQQAALNVIEGQKSETEARMLKKDLENYEDKLQAIFDDVATRKLTADAAWGQYEATKAWLEKQYGNKDAEKLKTYVDAGASMLGTIIDVASIFPQMKLLKMLKVLK